jgi:hypothetical protein
MISNGRAFTDRREAQPSASASLGVGPAMSSGDELVARER